MRIHESVHTEYISQAQYRRSGQPEKSLQDGMERGKQEGRANPGCVSPGLQIVLSAAEEGTAAARHGARIVW